MSKQDVRWLARRSMQGMAILVVLALVGSLAVRGLARARLAKARTAFAGKVGPVFSAHYEKPPIPKEENAAVSLEAGARTLVLQGPAETLRRIAGRPLSQWTVAERAFATEAIERNGHAVGILHEAARRTRSSYGILYREGIATRVPAFTDLRDAGLLLLADARLALARGDRSRALASLGAVSRLVDSLSDESIDSMTLIGRNLERWLDSLLAESAADPHLGRTDAAFLRELLQKLPKGDPVESAQRALAFSAASFSDVSWTAAPWPWRQDAQATVLEAGLRTIAVTKGPLAANPLPQEAGVDWPPFSDSRFRTMTDLYLIRMALDAQAIASTRQVVRAALVMRHAALETGEYSEDAATLPELTATTPLTGRPLRVERTVESGVIVDLGMTDAEAAHLSTAGTQASRWSTPPRIVLPGVGGARKGP